MAVSDNTVERLSIYRRLLRMQGVSDREYVYSHELAEMVSGTAAQVRRDLMELGVPGHSKHGYRTDELLTAIGAFLDDPDGTHAILIGLGDLGRAVLRFAKTGGMLIRIVAAFDNDAMKIGRVVHGYRCQPVAELESFLRANRVDVAIIAAPSSAAQGICDRLVASGVRGIVNFAPIPIRVPDGVRVERIDIATVLEKVACLVRRASGERGA